MTPFKLTRTLRLAPAAAQADGTRSGIAATWVLLESDGWEYVRGCFDHDVERIGAGGVVPLLWQHARMQPAIGRVLRLAQLDDGLHFSFDLNGTDLARAIDINIEAGTATDVSVDIDALAVDPNASHRITVARLSEISICTTGFGADQGAGLGRMSRLGMYDASSILEQISSIKSNTERLMTYLMAPSEYDWGSPVSEELETAIRDEAAALDPWIREQFAGLSQEN